MKKKKRAKLSNSKIKGSDNRQLQIEKYTKDIENTVIDVENKDGEKRKISFKNYKYKKFVYLCADKKDTEKTIQERLIDAGKVPNYIIDNLVLKHQKYKNFENNTVEWALKEFNYTIIEHSDIALILYDILREFSKDSFENGILKPIQKEEMFKLAEIVLTLYKNRTKKSANKIVKIFKNRIIEKYNKRCNVDEDKFFRYEIDVKGKLRRNIRISSNSKMYFWDKFDNNHGFTYQERLEILCRYVEYWELHKGIGNLSDNVEGYSKIVDGEYIWDICKKLSKDKEYWQKKKEELKETESNTLKELIHYINLDNLKDRLKEYKPPFEDLNKRRNISPSFNYDENNLEGEIWKEFPLDSKYMVSNLGRIKYEGKIQKQKDERIQYVTLADENLRKDFIYNFVAYTFLGKIEGDGMHVHHITNDGYYNTIENLILLTQDEHSYVHGFKVGG